MSRVPSKDSQIILYRTLRNSNIRCTQTLTQANLGGFQDVEFESGFISTSKCLNHKLKVRLKTDVIEMK